MEENHTPVVLIVDDEKNLRRLLRLTLKYLKCELYEATNGWEAIRSVAEHRPDIVILDIMMPGGIDGIEVCKRIKSTPDAHGPHVILLTAMGQERDRKAGMEANADAYITKPFSPIQLVSVIEDFVLKMTDKREL